MWSDKAINLVAFDIPYPPMYGGIIDVYYKIKALKEAGIKVHLHCFEYNKPRQKHLLSVCESVNYYSRNFRFTSQAFGLPYIVSSRNSPALKINLAENDYPVVMEGLHTTALLKGKHLSNRFVLVRTHNIEHVYYKGLAAIEPNPFKKFYFNLESSRLKAYEKILMNAASIAAISPDDTVYFQSRYGHTFHLPAFHPFKDVVAQEGRGNYALFHGNLAINENNQAALWLVRNVFNQLPFKLLVAGANPGKDLITAIERSRKHELIPNPDSNEMNDLLTNAHCILLPAFQSSGIKLKLLSSLFAGRFCIANDFMISNTGLENLCIRADSETEFIQSIQAAFSQTFHQSNIEHRKKILEDKYNNAKNAALLCKVIFGG